ncbi:MAG: hypothetical protein RLZZ292_2130 [Bacteroidota bacterium]|jgi:glutamate racemase
MIGVFDSGYGGLTVLKEFITQLPNYDYLYLGDNARAPYGTRSFDTVYAYTLECVQFLFDQGCPLVILACNTASAKALRNIQQLDLERIAPQNRVLGVIRPTTEQIGHFSFSKKIGIFGTNGTVASQSYPMEINKFFPEIQVFQQACPLWVPLIENDDYQNEGADFFIQKYLDELLAQDAGIDTFVLACTHYPLLRERIQYFLDKKKLIYPIKIVSQGEIVADSLNHYLLRHPQMEQRLTKNQRRLFCTTDDAKTFDLQSAKFLGMKVRSKHITL